MTNNHTKQETPKRRIQNPVKHLRSSFFPKIVSGFQPLTICRKKLYLRCSTGFWIRLFKKKHSHKRINCTFLKEPVKFWWGSMFLFLESFQPKPSRGFHVETTWKRSFPRRFNVKSTWCVSRECSYFVLISYEAFLPVNDRNYSWH